MALGELLNISQAYIWAFSLLFFRVGAAMAFLPAFGEMAVPVRIKLAAALAFSAVLAPVVLDDIILTKAQRQWPMMIAGEVVAGFIVGFLFRALVFVLQIAGTIAAQSTSLSQFFGAGLGADPQPAFSTLLVISGLCLATMMGLHLRIIEAFLLSFDMMPMGHFPNPSTITQWGVAQVSYAFGLGFTLAGPFVVASMIYNLGLGAINKAMPQLMVAFVGAPAISWGGLALLMVSAPFMLSVWARAFEAANLTREVGF